MKNENVPLLSPSLQKEIKDAALVNHLQSLVNMPRPLHTAAPAEDAVADEEWDTETQKLQQQILNVGPVMDRSDLFDHEQTVFDQELNKLRLS